MKGYSKELKLSAIKDYDSGHYSQRDIIKKYNIPSTSVLRRWIKNYNGHRKIKDTGEGRNQSMTKGRSTTWKERIDIVYYCLSWTRIIKEQLINIKCLTNRCINGSESMKLVV